MAGRTSTRKYLASKIASGIGGRVNVIQDERSCADCNSKAGKYTTATPPYHPNCRCTLGK